jgi:hypothetical protein
MGLTLKIVVAIAATSKQRAGVAGAGAMGWRARRTPGDSNGRPTTDRVAAEPVARSRPVAKAPKARRRIGLFSAPAI